METPVRPLPVPPSSQPVTPTKTAAPLKPAGTTQGRTISQIANAASPLVDSCDTLFAHSTLPQKTSAPSTSAPLPLLLEHKVVRNDQDTSPFLERANLPLPKRLQKAAKDPIDKFATHVTGLLDRLQAKLTSRSELLVACTTKVLNSLKENLTLKVNSRNLDGDERVPPPLTLKGRNAYAEINHTFTGANGVVRGTEQIKRIPVIEQREKALQAKIRFLEDQLQKAVGDTPKILKINKEIGACKVDLMNCQRNLPKRSWIGSNASRDVIGNRGFAEERTKFVPAAVNYRTQSVTTHLADGKTVTETFSRFGAVWDPKNGLINLKELTEFLEMRQSPAPEKQALLKRLIEERILNLEEMKQTYTSADQLALIDEACTKLKGLLSPAGSVEFKQSLDFIASKRRFLREQLLDPILGQLKGNGDKLLTAPDGTKTFPMLHLGLLNRKANGDFQASGWAHLEKNQIAEMAQIFKELQGCQIVVSETEHSFFGVEDDSGKPILYLSKADAPNKDLKVGDQITLSTCFMNVSVQGHTTNDGIQQEVNRQSLQQLNSWAKLLPDITLRKKMEASLAAIQTRLDAGESSFALAGAILMCAKDMAAVSEGCLSCKDRGGTIAEELAIGMMESNLMNQKDIDTQDQKNIKLDMQAFVQKIFHKGSPTIQVVEDNTGVDFVKVEYWRVPKLAVSNIVRNLAIVVWKSVTGGLDVKPE